MAALAAILRYIYETGEQVSEDEVRALIAGIAGKEAEEQIMTLAERLRLEGEQRGIEKGIEKGIETGQLAASRAALRRVLGRRGLTLTPHQNARIEECSDLAMLERWLDQAIDAPSAAQALR